jgi:hypothetical protein
LGLDTNVAFGSPHWLNVSEGTVKVVLNSDLVGVSEPELLCALIKWGQEQFFRAKGSAPDDVQLRAKIDPFLKLLRFASMDVQEFGAFSKTCKVLTDKEMLMIMRSIALGCEEDLPEEFSTCSISRTTYVAPLQCTNTINDSYISHGHVLRFSADKPVYLLGIAFDHSNFRELEVKWDDGIFNDEFICKLGTEIVHNGTNFIAFKPEGQRPFYLQKNCVCSVKLLVKPFRRPSYKISSLPPLKHDQAKITLHSKVIDFKVYSLLLKNAQ